MKRLSANANRSFTGNSYPVVESLEGRTLLSSVPYLFTDVDGDAVKITLSGAGNMAVTPGTTGIDTIALTNTDAATSVLKISVTRKSGGDGLLKVGEITAATPADAGLKAVKASKVDLTGNGIVMHGWLAAVSIHDLSNSAGILADQIGENDRLIDWPTDQKTTVSIRNVGDNSTISLSSHVTTLTANQFGSGVILQAASLGKVSVKGDFAGQLLVSNNSVGSINIRGNASGLFKIAYYNGDVGSVKVGSTDGNWSLSTSSNIGSLTSKGDMPYSTIMIGGGISSLTANGDMSGAGNFRIGNSQPGYLTSASVTGNVSGVWNVSNGGIGKVAIGSASNWDVNVAAAVGSLTCKGNLGLAKWNSQSIGALTVSGNIMGGAMTLSQEPDAEIFALGKVKITGQINNAIVAAGNINTVTVGDIRSGSIVAGGQDDVTQITADTSADSYLLDTTTRINRITVKGINGTPAMLDGAIIAGAIGKASFKNVDVADDATLGGLAAINFDSISLTQAGKTYKWDGSDFAPTIDTGHFTVLTLE